MATWLLVDMGLDKSVAIITDGRFWGTSGGPCVGHIVPEAMDGGPIAVLRDGDMIEIDIPSRKLGAELSEEDIRQRLKSWNLKILGMPPEITVVSAGHF